MPAEAMLPVRIPVDYSQVTNAISKLLQEVTEAAKQQMTDLHMRCEKCAESQKSRRKSSAGKAAGNLDFEIRVNEEADQNDDMWALLNDLITRDGKCAKITPGEGETEARAKVLQSALEYELDRMDGRMRLRKAIGKGVVFPFAGMKAVREMKNGQQHFYFDHINPMTFAVADIGRPLSKQFAVVEFYSLTKREMRRAGFRNLDKLGTADSTFGSKTKMNNSSATMNSSTQVQGNEHYDVYCVWISPPFMDDLTGMTPKYSAVALEEWANDWQIPPQYVFDGPGMANDDGRIYRMWHHNGIPLMNTTNYLTTPLEYPHKTFSFHEPPEDVFAGESQSERSADAFAAVHVAINAMMDNMRMIANQSYFISDRSSVSDEAFQRIFKPRGVVRFAGDDSPTDLFLPFKPESIAGDMMGIIQFFQNVIENHGVNDVMRGLSKARTATENANNNARGQTQVNQSGSRFVDEVVVPVVRDLIRMICAFYTPDDWFRVAGEDGAMMMDGLSLQADPEWVDRHFRVEGIGSFEYMNQSAKIAELANILNICAAFLPPDMAFRMMKVMLEHTRMSRSEIEYIEGNKGSYTDMMNEIEALKKDPLTDVEVTPGDPRMHAFAIQAVGMVVEGDPATGEPPWPEFMQYRGVKKYYQTHQAALQAILQQQMEMGMMEAQLAPETGSGLKGKPKQIPSEGLPTDDISMVRSAGQTHSPTDFNRQPGQTGQGSPVG